MKRNIVILEDVHFLRTFLKQALTKKGFDVHEAENGMEILRTKKFNPSTKEDGLLDKIIPDLFILDISLKDISGIEILKKLRSHKDYKDTPIIMNSSHNDRETIVAAITSGATDYILKKDNYAQIILDKIDKYFKEELSTFESTLKRELDWIIYGGKELALALIVITDMKDTKNAIDKENLEKVNQKLKESIRHYDSAFILDDNKTIAIILPLANMQNVIKLQKVFLEKIKALSVDNNILMEAQIGFSHYPSNAKSARELVLIANEHIE
jgi:CheY-like chemotaxis protein